VSFEVIPAGKAIGGDALKDGQASLGSNGSITVRTSDLAEAGIVGGGKAIVLADPATLRIAVRAPRDGETEGASVSPLTTGKGKRSETRCRVNMSRALKAIGIEARDVAGRYGIEVHREGEAPPLLILNLTKASDRDLKRRGEPRKK
jgi:hypothetical protein